MTDDAGLGTPAVHDWLNRESRGHAVLDAARAARKLPGTSLGAASPLAIAGYSQGGGAAASVNSLAAAYPEARPELDRITNDRFRQLGRGQLNWNTAVWSVPSMRVRSKVRQVPAHALSVCHT